MGGAPATAMLWPAVAMVALIFLVWIRLYHLRFAEMARKRLHAQDVASSAQSTAQLSDTRASDNFRNLFELPVLFFVAVLMAAQLHVDDGLSVGLAWAFVASRAVHSLIQCTSNHVLSRFAVYVIGALVLLALWIRLAWMMTSL